MITISDNGQGMTEEEKKEIQEKLDHPEGKREGGIGLSNVANRIYHFFGREAQIRRVRTGSGNEIYIDTTIPESRDNVKRGE